jgi:hypothetical protein
VGATSLDLRDTCAITCAVATANGFAQPYRAKIVVHQDKPESSVLDLDAEGLRESVAARLRGLREKPTLILKTSSQPASRISDHVLFTLSLVLFTLSLA